MKKKNYINAQKLSSMLGMVLCQDFGLHKCKKFN